jgi:hypothetical protein
VLVEQFEEVAFAGQQLAEEHGESSCHATVIEPSRSGSVAAAVSRA